MQKHDDPAPKCYGNPCDDHIIEMKRVISAASVVLDPMGFPGANIKRSREQRKKLNEGS